MTDQIITYFAYVCVATMLVCQYEPARGRLRDLLAWRCRAESLAVGVVISLALADFAALYVVTVTP